MTGSLSGSVSGLSIETLQPALGALAALGRWGAWALGRWRPAAPVVFLPWWLGGLDRWMALAA